ncbi:MAG: cupredoxin domain-containing protein [Euryarchaeota archaeon]|nr:cupredoxin domain-containing protein [Euryarchaeota archaeon]
METRPVAVLALIVIALVAGGIVSAQVHEDDVVEVRTTDRLKFDPETITIEAGTTVRWVNDGGGFHTVTSSDSIEAGKRDANGDFDATLSSRGKTYERTFDELGEYPYFCQPHTGADMVGTIVVTGEPAGGDGGTKENQAPVSLLAFLFVMGLVAALVGRRRSG